MQEKQDSPSRTPGGLGKVGETVCAYIHKSAHLCKQCVLRLHMWCWCLCVSSMCVSNLYFIAKQIAYAHCLLICGLLFLFLLLLWLVFAYVFQFFSVFMCKHLCIHLQMHLNLASACLSMFIASTLSVCP